MKRLTMSSLLTLLLCAACGSGGSGAGDASNATAAGSSGESEVMTAARTVDAAGSPAPSSSQSVPANTVSIAGKGQYSTIRQAAQAAVNGDVIEIGPGTYSGDVAIWPQSNIVIRGVGGRPVLDAAGVSAGGKGIFVIQGANVTVENLEFINAKVPDLNGAGIRMEGPGLVVRNSVFRNNEEGILTVSNANGSLEIYDSQFIGNAFAYSGGYSHAIYVGRLGRFVVQGSYFTRTQEGHLIKSRARENHILYNRITDESQGTASYEIDLPDGGVSYVSGNLVEQSAGTGNPVIITFGEESTSVWPSNQLYLTFNTVVNRRVGSCTWLRAPGAATTVKAVNNLLLGNCGTSVPGTAQIANTIAVTDADFVAPAAYDFRLKTGSAAIGAAVAAGTANGVSLTPAREYVHPASTRAIVGTPADAGAFQGR